MLLKVITCLLASILVFLSIPLAAQDVDSIMHPKEYNKIVSLTLLGPAGLYSFNNSWVINNKPSGKLLFQLHGSYFEDHNTFNSQNDQNLITGFTLLHLFGGKKGHFHLGIGHSFVFTKAYATVHDPEILYEPRSYYTNWGYLFADVGYSYWNPTRRFYFKFSFNPLFNYQKKDMLWQTIHPWLGLSFGYAYGKKDKSSYLATGSQNSDKKLSIGLENNAGYAEMATEYGHSGGLTVSNYINMSYSPSRLVFNVKAGNAWYGIKKVTSSQGAEMVFDKPLSFWGVGFGVGCRLFKIKGWYLSPEITGGTYFNKEVNRTITRPESGYAISDLIVDQSYTLYYNNLRYLGLSLQLKKQIAHQLEFSGGFQYKTISDITIREYTAVISLNYKML